MRIGRKILCLLLVFILAMPLVTACGKDGDDNHIVVSYITMGTDPVDLNLVAEEINKITKEKIGVTIEFKPLFFMDQQTKYQNWIGGGDEIDILCFALRDPAPLIAQGMVKSLDDYIPTNAPDVVDLVEEGYPLYLKSSDNKTYGIATVEVQYGYGGSYVVKKSVLDAAGLGTTYTDRQRIEYSDLDTIFAAIKAYDSNIYPSGNLVDVSRYFNKMDMLGATLASGALMLDSTTPTTVVNYYESQEYQAYINKMQSWKSSGYLLQDAAVTDTPFLELLQAGTFCGVYLDCWESLKNEYEARLSEEMVQLYINDLYYMFGKPHISWGVASTSKKVEAAVKYINLMMSDVNVMNLVQWGIEGKHYKFTDRSNGIIDFADGVTSASSGFYNTLGLYGDKREIYSWDTGADTAELAAMREREREMVETALSNPSPGVGFVYNTAAKINEITAIEAVIVQYERALGTGNGANYSAFIAALKSAGIESVIADKQAQFNTWLNK